MGLGDPSGPSSIRPQLPTPKPQHLLTLASMQYKAWGAECWVDPRTFILGAVGLGLKPCFGVGSSNGLGQGLVYAQGQS